MKKYYVETHDRNGNRRRYLVKTNLNLPDVLTVLRHNGNHPDIAFQIYGTSYIYCVRANSKVYRI